MITTICENLRTVRDKIADAVKRSPFSTRKVTLVAVSKNRPIRLIQAAISAGQYQFAENYVQEMVEKVSYFRGLKTEQPLVWHFIGSLQSNKTKLIAEHCDWVHTVDRIKIAKRLSLQRSAIRKPINLLIQVNITGEKHKSGLQPCNLPDLVRSVYSLPNVKLRGLMTIAAAESSYAEQCSTFKILFQLYRELKKQYSGIDTLSMGMSNDIEAAVVSGSTMVRIGSALFKGEDSTLT